jgi:AcrR family transcriptional regulator
MPKTARGIKTRNKLLEAAEVEFGEKGFHAAAISGITHRAGVALGTFYTYFESKDEIFQALVTHMSRRTRKWVGERISEAPDRIDAERMGMQAFFEFVQQHKGIYRIITEAEFVAEDAYRDHYERFARGYQNNLQMAAEKGQIRDGDFEMWSWAIMGMAVFLGMRYAAWDEDETPAKMAEVVTDLIANGIKA